MIRIWNIIGKYKHKTLPLMIKFELQLSFWTGYRLKFHKSFNKTPHACMEDCKPNCKNPTEIIISRNELQCSTTPSHDYFRQSGMSTISTSKFQSQSTMKYHCIKRSIWLISSLSNQQSIKAMEIHDKGKGESFAQYLVTASIIVTSNWRCHRRPRRTDGGCDGRSPRRHNPQVVGYITQRKDPVPLAAPGRGSLRPLHIVPHPPIPKPFKNPNKGTIFRSSFNSVWDLDINPRLFLSGHGLRKQPCFTGLGHQPRHPQ